MEIAGYICCILGLLSMMSTTSVVALQNKVSSLGPSFPNNFWRTTITEKPTQKYILKLQIDRQFFDSLPPEDAPKDKRPFCNAFTGCGKKRSFDLENTLGGLGESSKRIRIPVPIYRALLRASSQEVRESLERETSAENAMSDIAMEYPAYLARKMQIREGYRS